MKAKELNLSERQTRNPIPHMLEWKLGSGSYFVRKICPRWNCHPCLPRRPPSLPTSRVTPINMEIILVSFLGTEYVGYPTSCPSWSSHLHLLYKLQWDHSLTWYQAPCTSPTIQPLAGWDPWSLISATLMSEHLQMFRTHVSRNLCLEILEHARFIPQPTSYCLLCFGWNIL